jgi:hypothetical protein
MCRLKTPRSVQVVDKEVNADNNTSNTTTKILRSTMQTHKPAFQMVRLRLTSSLPQRRNEEMASVLVRKFLSNTFYC